MSSVRRFCVWAMGVVRGRRASPPDFNARADAGFTLIELMVVLTIIALLVVLVAPKFISRTDDARITATKVQIRNIESALQLYKLDNGLYPTTEQGLAALVSPPAIPPVPTNWKAGGYLQKVPVDSWKRAFVYLSPGAYNVDYDLLSYGADGESGGEGNNADIVSWDLE